MDAKQTADRAQFMRYAEAALSGLLYDRMEFDTDRHIAVRAFDLATAMMLAEGQAFERYEILALEAITADERARHAEGS
jgi:hypothetical protein